MTDAPTEARSWTQSPWAKWSWLLLLGVIVAQSLNYHCRGLPTTAAGYFARGRADYLLGEYESAIGNFTKSIELQSTDADSYIWRGEAYAKLHDFGHAMPDLEKALALRPDYAKSHAGYADGKAAAWDTEGAISEYSRAIEMDPDYGRCYLERGKMLYDAGRWGEAVTDLRHASTVLIGDREITAHLFLWVARARAGDPTGATAELAHTLKLGTMHTNRFWNSAHFLCGELAEPVYLTAAAAVVGDDEDTVRAEAYFLAGTKRLLARDRSGALTLLRKALDTDPEGSYAYERARVELCRLLPGFHAMRIAETRRMQLGLAADIGLEVASVDRGGPAEASGLRPGSILAAVDGTDVGPDAFVAFLGNAAPGSTVTLGIIDGAGSRRSLPLALRPDASAPTR